MPTDAQNDPDFRVYLTKPISITGIKRPETFVPLIDQPDGRDAYFTARLDAAEKIFADDPKDIHGLREAHAILTEARTLLQSRPEPNGDWLSTIKGWEEYYFSERVHRLVALGEAEKQNPEALHGILAEFRALDAYLTALPAADRKWHDVVKSWVGGLLYDIHAADLENGHVGMIEGLAWIRTAHAMGNEDAVEALASHTAWYRPLAIIKRIVFEKFARDWFFKDIGRGLRFYRAILADIRRHSVSQVAGV